MLTRLLLRVALASAALGAAGCASDVPKVSTPTAAASSIPEAAAQTSARLLDWPEFGLNPQRSSTSELSSGITVANVAHLRRASVALEGTIDSSPIYLHGALVAGAVHDTIIVTSTYGRTVAIDAAGARRLWTFTPPRRATAAGRGARRSPRRARWPIPDGATSTLPRPTA